MVSRSFTCPVVLPESLNGSAAIGVAVPQVSPPAPWAFGRPSASSTAISATCTLARNRRMFPT